MTSGFFIKLVNEGMPMIEIRVCEKDERLWEAYILLLMRRYEELGLPYDDEMTLSFIGNPILGGNALIARDKETGHTVGVLGFVYGTGADYFEDDSTCQVEVIHIEQPWRHTKLFVTIILTLVAYLERQRPGTTRIQFWSPADRHDLNRIFGKLCTLIKTNEKSFGRISLFQTNTSTILSSLPHLKERTTGQYEIQLS
jgi:hypothetical protein